MLAPKSNRALSTRKFPILQVIVGDPGSLYLTGYLFRITELTCSVKNAFLGTFVLLFAVTKSFKNLAYAGTCLIASRNGMLICTCLNNSRISLSWPTFFGHWSLCGNGAFGIYSLMSGSGDDFFLAALCCSCRSSFGMASFSSAPSCTRSELVI